MHRTLALFLLVALPAACLLPTAGCDTNGDHLTDDRLSNGLVIILPGIEGQSDLNRNIRRGLIAGGVYRALPIHSWGRPVPLAGPLLNQMDFLGNRLAGVSVANMIKNYQDSHPGRPVHIIGHSGGGGVAVFAAEALPEDRKIDGLILLSASISSAYDLTNAARRCTEGIANFYNPEDALMLGGGTTIFGNVDGTHGPSAGLLGFDKAGQKGMENVYQVRLTGGEEDPHTSMTRIGFVSVHVAPWVLAGHWPVRSGVAYALDSRPGGTPRLPPAPEGPPQPGGPGGDAKPLVAAATAPAGQAPATRPANAEGPKPTAQPGDATGPTPATRPGNQPETRPANAAKQAKPKDLPEKKPRPRKKREPRGPKPETAPAEPRR